MAFEPTELIKDRSKHEERSVRSHNELLTASRGWEEEAEAVIELVVARRFTREAHLRAKPYKPEFTRWDPGIEQDALAELVHQSLYWPPDMTLQNLQEIMLCVQIALDPTSFGPQD